MRKLAPLALLALLAHCAPRSVTAEAGYDGGLNREASAPSDAALVGEASAPPQDASAPGDYRLEMPAVTLAPGQETTVCVDLRLGNTAAALLRGIDVHLSAGSHHLIVYRSTMTTERTTPTPCPPLGGVTSGMGPLYIAQSQDSTLTMPDGVGVSLAAGQIVRLEEHFLNVGTSPLQGTATVTLHTAAPSASLQAADLLFWGTTAINVPPRSMGSATSFNLVPAGTRVFGLTAHTHHLGTLTTVTQTASASASGTELFRNTNWAEPPLRLFTPPLSFDGSTGLRLDCTYNNTTDLAVHFGESAATAEMCFFWGYYYPSHGFDARF